MKISLLHDLPLSLFVVLFVSCTATKEIEQTDRHSLELAREYSENTSGEALLVWADGNLILEDYTL